MARLTRVKAAQQRYKTVPVMEDGHPKVVTATRKGKTYTRRVTVEDRSQPLPPRNCGKCHQPIEVGTPYVWWASRAPGSRSGARYQRHDTRECYPQPWELEGNPKRAALMLAEHTLEEAISGDLEAVEDFQSAMETFAEAVREVAQEYEDGADNIEQGFGTATSTSDDLREKADTLNSAADECESVDFEDAPEVEDFHYSSDGEDLDEIDAAALRAERAILAEDEEEHEEAIEEIDAKLEAVAALAEGPQFNDDGISYEDALAAWRDECRDKCQNAASEAQI